VLQQASSERLLFRGGQVFTSNDGRLQHHLADPPPGTLLTAKRPEVVLSRHRDGPARAKFWHYSSNKVRGALCAVGQILSCYCTMCSRSQHHRTIPPQQWILTLRRNSRCVALCGSSIYLQCWKVAAPVSRGTLRCAQLQLGAGYACPGFFYSEVAGLGWLAVMRLRFRGCSQ
jgi:hypothetical protein